MDNHCITCKFCDHSEGHVCTLGRLPIDDPYSDSCESYAEELMNKQAIRGSDALPNPSIAITTVQPQVFDEIPVTLVIRKDRKAEQPYSIGVDLASKPDVDCRICPDCQQSVKYDDMIWLNGRCTCPQCYIKRRAQLDAQKEDNHAE